VKRRSVVRVRPAERLVGALFSALLGASLALGYSSGPPDGKTGKPGEGTCLDCHSGGSGSSDSAFVTGFDGSSYAPGKTYSLALHVSYAGQLRWGFELTTVAINSGDYAGELMVTDSTNTQISTSGGRSYLKHTSIGTHAGQPDSATWTFQWLAPASGTGTVVFYWCNNAANNNGASSGDTIVRDSLVLSEATGTSEREGTSRRWLWRYTNPAQNRVVVSYRGSAGEPVRIYSSTGRLIRRLLPTRDGETMTATWDGRDQSRALVPEASYFLRLGAKAGSVISVRLVR
jgi:hypothetical protein